MAIEFRYYGRVGDFNLVGQFLVKHYLPDNQDGNWLQPTWEYMHYHPLLDEDSLSRIGIWEDSGDIIAVAHYEWRLGEAYFQIHPDYSDLKTTLLDYAEEHLFYTSDSGEKSISAFINDNDPKFSNLVRSRGYQQIPDHDRPLAMFAIPNPFPEIHLPDGFQVKSLADEPDWAKVHQVMWRGFNHEGEPPGGEGELEERRKMFETPNARMDLKIVILAPNGDFASLSGLWYEPVNHYALVEPVATDPEYRRLGLGKAAVLEGIRRCGEAGATVAYVGSNQAFYLSFGFEVLYTTKCWKKVL